MRTSETLGRGNRDQGRRSGTSPVCRSRRTVSLEPLEDRLLLSDGLLTGLTPVALIDSTPPDAGQPSGQAAALVAQLESTGASASPSEATGTGGANATCVGGSREDNGRAVAALETLGDSRSRAPRPG